MRRRRRCWVAACWYDERRTRDASENLQWPWCILGVRVDQSPLAPPTRRSNRNNLDMEAGSFRMLWPAEAPLLHIQHQRTASDRYVSGYYDNRNFCVLLWLLYWNFTRQFGCLYGRMHGLSEDSCHTTYILLGSFYKTRTYLPTNIGPTSWPGPVLGNLDPYSGTWT